MDLAEMQAELRHFAAERDWQPFHSPKNLSMALMVEAAELAEIFQWMTPEESRAAHQGAEAKGRIGEEVADVMLYLLQVADHCGIDIAQAVKDKLARNAAKYPAKRSMAMSTRTSATGAHVLLDYENVQPSESELRAVVPDANCVWVFHGPHQHHVAQRFASFGSDVTAVPISRTGKNALDFHLSCYMGYMGYIASRNPASKFVVVANDKGYEPMLEHARAMGFMVRRQSHGQAQSLAGEVTAKKTPVKKAPAGKVAVKKEMVKQVLLTQAPVKKSAAKKAVPPTAANKASAAKTVPVKKVLPVKQSVVAPAASAASKPVAAPISKGASGPAQRSASLPQMRPSTVSAGEVMKIIENLRKMGEKRSVKPSSLRRTLKSFLGAETGDQSIEVAFGELMAAGVVLLGANGDVKYASLELQSVHGAGQA